MEYGYIPEKTLLDVGSTAYTGASYPIGDNILFSGDQQVLIKTDGVNITVSSPLGLTGINFKVANNPTTNEFCVMYDGATLNEWAIYSYDPDTLAFTLEHSGNTTKADNHQRSIGYDSLNNSYIIVDYGILLAIDADAGTITDSVTFTISANNNASTIGIACDNVGGGVIINRASGALRARAFEFDGATLTLQSSYSTLDSAGFTSITTNVEYVTGGFYEPVSGKYVFGILTYQDDDAAIITVTRNGTTSCSYTGRRSVSYYLKGFMDGYAPQDIIYNETMGCGYFLLGNSVVDITLGLVGVDSNGYPDVHSMTVLQQGADTTTAVSNYDFAGLTNGLYVIGCSAETEEFLLAKMEIAGAGGGAVKLPLELENIPKLGILGEVS